MSSLVAHLSEAGDPALTPFVNDTALVAVESAGPTRSHLEGLSSSIGFDQGRMLCLVSLGDAAVAGLASVAACAGDVQRGRALLDDPRLAAVTFSALSAARALGCCRREVLRRSHLRHRDAPNSAEIACLHGDLRRVAEELVSQPGRSLRRRSR